MKIRLKNKDQIPFKIVPVVLKPAEARHQNEKIFEAYALVLSSILKRPVSQAELFGIKSLEQDLERA